MSVTIKDVARESGVSPSTVSRVLSNHPRISKTTANKVRQVMEELGYHSNSVARSLVSSKTYTIGMILPRPAEELFQNHFFAEIIRGITTQASRSGYDVLMTAVNNDRDEMVAITRLVKGRKVDGIILLQSRKDDPVIYFLEEEQFPYVLIGKNVEFPNIAYVDNDNVQAAYDATVHLISQGHERIGFVSGPPNLTVSQDRLEGYNRALREFNLPMNADWIVEVGFLQESGYMAMSFYMGMPECPSALVVIDDSVALGVMRGLNELGFQVPEDLALISFNNIMFAEMSSPALSSVDIGIYQLGYMASQLLIRQIEDSSMQKNCMIVPHRLMIRQSSLHQLAKRS